MMADLMLRVLTEDDLPYLLDKYFEYHSQWKDIGLELEFTLSDLESIETEQLNRQKDCFREMIGKWLRRSDNPTEKKFCDTARHIFCRAHGNKTVHLTEKEPSHYNIYCDIIVKYLCIIIIIFTALLVIMLAYHLMSGSTIDVVSNKLKHKFKAATVIENSIIRPDVHTKFLNVSFMDNSNTDVELEEVIQNYTGTPGALAIIGKPGSGKTTLSRYLAKEWAEGRALQSCKILFVIFFSFSHKKVILRLEDLLRESWHNNTIEADIDDIAEIISNNEINGACFLLDNYEEGLYKFVDDEIYNKINFSSFYILTSRSPIKDRTGLSTIKITGFNTKYLRRYLSLLSKNNTVTKAVRRLWTKKKEVTKICTLPLNMMMVISIITSEPNLNLTLSTTTDIYTKFITVTARTRNWWDPQLWEKCIFGDNPCLRSNSCCALKTLHDVAFRIRFLNQHSFRLEARNISTINELGFVSIIPDGVEGNIMYDFIHQTFLEFFAAVHLVSLPEDQLIPYLTIYRNNQNFQKVWQFMFGLIGKYSATLAPRVLKQFSFEPSILKDKMIENICKGSVHSSIFEFVKEIGSHDKVSKKFLESAGIVVNGALCLRHETTLPFTMLPDIQQLWKTDTIQLKIVLIESSKNVSHDISDCVKLQTEDHILCPPSSALITHMFYEIRGRHEIKKLGTKIKEHSKVSLRDIQLDGNIHLNRYVYTRATIIASAWHINRWIEALPKVSELHIIIDTEEADSKEQPSKLPADYISKLFRYARDLNELVIINSDEHVSELPSFLYSGFTSLTHLSLTNWTITGINVENFLNFLRQNRKLSVLDLTGTYLDNSGYQRMINNLPRTLFGLSLNNIHLNDDDVYNLSTSLQQLYFLTSLSLQKNDISIATFKELTKVMLNLKFLDVRQNAIFDPKIRTRDTESLHDKMFDMLAVSLNDTINIKSLARLTTKLAITIRSTDLEIDDETMISIFTQLSKVQMLQVCTSREDWNNEMKVKVVRNVTKINFFSEDSYNICFYIDF